MKETLVTVIERGEGTGKRRASLPITMQVRFNTHGWRGGRNEDWVWGVSDCGAAP